MTRKTISLEEAQRDFAEMLRDVSTRGDHFVVESDGEAVAAVVSINVIASMEEDRKALIDQMDRASEQANVSDEEAETLALEAVEWARKHVPPRRAV